MERQVDDSTMTAGSDASLRRKMSLKRGMRGLDEASTDPNRLNPSGHPGPSASTTADSDQSADPNASLPLGNSQPAHAQPSISVTGPPEIEEVSGFGQDPTDCPEETPPPVLGATQTSTRRKAGPAPAAPTDIAPAPDLSDTARDELLSKMTDQPKAGGALRLDDQVPVAKRKKSRTIKKGAGKLLVRLKQLVDGCDSPADLPP
jgi:hypothetical protein